MYSPQQQAQQYKTQEILNASKEQVLLMLYDGAIRFLKIAQKAIENKETATAHTHLLKTQKILSELMVSLNFDVGGEPAKNLYNLYEYYYYRLVQANLKKDPTMVNEVITHLSDLRQTWHQAIKQANRDKATSSIPSASPAITAQG